ncbi:unnamed protein product [Effrenium voratum]|nr:unnamed protein product [Effrenium voratum]
MLRGFHAFSSTSELKCRDRTIDVSMNCVDCVRLLQGGFYGHMGVAVPAHPPQSSVNGCLALSQERALNVSAHPADDQTSGSWDSARTSQYAFCQQAAARPPPLFRRLTQGTSLDGREDVGEKLAHRRWFKPDGYDHHAIFVAWQENPEGFVVHHPIGKRLRGKIRHEVRNLRDYTLARALAVGGLRSGKMFSRNALCLKGWFAAEPDEVLQRALSRVGESGYNLIWKNCEHFTEWCMTGQHRSAAQDGAKRAEVS